MTTEQKEKLTFEMVQFLQMAKRALEKGETEKAERRLAECFGMERTLLILGYEVEIDVENCTVNIK